MEILVTGGTGFVGHGIVPQLLKDGHEVVCLVRAGSERKLPTRLIDGVERLQIAHGDLLQTESLGKALEGCDAVVHLVGIIREKKKKGVTFENVHVKGTQNILTASKQAGIKKFIHMSALGTRKGAACDYHKTKYEAEQAVINSGIPYTIFRPSVIFGPGDEFVNMLTDIVRLPVTPVIGDGQYKLQPVSRQTIAEVFSQALVSEKATGEIYEVGGPLPLTYVQMIDSIGKVVGKSKVRKVHIPLAFMQPIVTVMESLPFFPITQTQFIMLQEGNTCKDTRKLYDTFTTSQIHFEEGISSYLH